MFPFAKPTAFQGMVYAVNPSIKIASLSHVYDIDYLYSFFIEFFTYSTLSYYSRLLRL
jgi:hypothetical protein